MSHREHVRYFLNAVSKSSQSVDLTNEKLTDCQVSTSGDHTIYVYGVLDGDNIGVILENFEVYDDIKNPEVLKLLEE